MHAFIPFTFLNRVACSLLVSWFTILSLCSMCLCTFKACSLRLVVWTFPGVMAFFVLLGFFGLILHCSSFNTNDPRMAGCQNCCYGWGVLDCFPASMEACFALVIVFVVIFAILGIAYGFLAATMAIQKIWQKHYHILTKKELTKVKSGSFCPLGICVMPSI